MVSLKTAIGGLAMPPTKRLILPTIWVDLIHPSPSNGLFQSRLAKYRGEGLKEFLEGTTVSFDDDGKLSTRIITMMFEFYMADWGGWNTKGNATPLSDDEGNVVECTLENVTEVFREIDGGVALFVAIAEHVKNKAWFAIQQSAEEKNSLPPSLKPVSLARKRSTQKGRKQEVA